MTEKRYTIGDYTNCQYDICEILEDDEVYCIVGTEYADKIINELNTLNDENEDLKNNIGEQGVRLDFAICETQDFKNKWLKLKKENEQLKQSVNNLKETILKITIAYQRKHDNTIVNLVDEVHEEDITDLIKELKE